MKNMDTTQFNAGDRVRVTAACCDARVGDVGVIEGEGTRKSFLNGGTRHSLALGNTLQLEKIDQATDRPYQVGDVVRLGDDRYGIGRQHGDLFRITDVSTDGDRLGVRPVGGMDIGFAVRRRHVTLETPADEAPTAGPRPGDLVELTGNRQFIGEYQGDFFQVTRATPGNVHMTSIRTGTEFVSDPQHITVRPARRGAAPVGATVYAKLIFEDHSWARGVVTDRDTMRVDEAQGNGQWASEGDRMFNEWYNPSEVTPVVAPGPLRVGDRVIARDNRRDGGHWDAKLGQAGRFEGFGFDGDIGYVTFDGDTRRTTGWVLNMEKVSERAAAGSAPQPVRTPSTRDFSDLDDDEILEEIFFSGNEIEFTVTARLTDDSFVVGCKSPSISDVMKVAQKVEKDGPVVNLTVRAIVQTGGWNGALIRIGASTTIEEGELSEYGRDYKLISTLVTPEPEPAPAAAGTTPPTPVVGQSYRLLPNATWMGGESRIKQSLRDGVAEVTVQHLSGAGGSEPFIRAVLPNGSTTESLVDAQFLVPLDDGSVTDDNVTVTLTREQALALVALSGSVGGDPDHARGKADEAFEVLNASLDPSGYLGYSAAQRQLGATVIGSIRFGQADPIF